MNVRLRNRENNSAAKSVKSNTRKQQLEGFGLDIPEMDKRADDGAEIRSIPLGDIADDGTNTRTKHLDYKRPNENPFKDGDPLFNEYKNTIREIEELAEQLKTSTLRQPITVYQKGGKNYVGWGHRRFYAMLIAWGESTVVKVRFIEGRPKDLRVARFQENSQQKELSLRAFLEEFGNAKRELIENEDGISQNEIGVRLGLSKAYVSILARASENGDLTRKLEDGANITKTDLNEICDSSKDEIEEYLKQKQTKKKERKQARGAEKKAGENTLKSISIKKPENFIKDKQVWEKLAQGEYKNYFEEKDFYSLESLIEKISEIWIKENE
ncbi:hypothetical protein A3715_15475 [Oleiphilus sp. HI0009]|nr:hypothetical protein A3715_15475 [Oleiphilus sp. HI0009]